MKTRRKRIRIGTKRRSAGTKRKTRKKRGAYLSDLEDSDDEMNNEQGWGADTEFLVKNDEVNINAFLSEIRRRQNEGSYVIHSPSDELGLEFLHSMMMESLLTGEYVEGIYGVTYAPNRNEGQYGRFFANYFDDTDSLTERLQIVSENNRFPNDVTQLQSAVEEQIILPHPGGESPDTIMEVDDLSGGRKRRRKKKTRKKRGGELKDLSVEELKAALDNSLSFHIHLFGQLVDASGEFNYKFRHPNWEPGEPSVEEQLFGKYEDWRYDKMMEHKGIWTDYGDEMGQYIANAPIDELNGTMDFYCENWKSALGERLKNSILNFKKINKEKIQEINREHLFEWGKLVKKSKSLEKLYLKFIDRIKKIYEVYKEKKKMKDVEERQEKKETDEEYGTFDAGADIDDPDYDEALDQYRKYYKGEDIKPMMKAYFDNNGFGWDGVAPNEILGHNDYKKPLIDITKHTKDNIEEEFNYHYFDGEWVEITTEESIKPIVWVIENTQNNINRFASSELPERVKDSLTIGFDKMIETMTQDGEMTGGFWIVEWNEEREKDDTYNNFHLAWTDYDTEDDDVIRFVEPTGGGRRRKKKTRKKRGGGKITNYDLIDDLDDKDGECHSAYGRILGLLEKKDFKMTEQIVRDIEYTLEKFKELTNKNLFYLIRFETPLHKFVIEINGSQMRILSLYCSRHGFKTYAHQSVFGKYFEIGGETYNEMIKHFNTISKFESYMKNKMGYDWNRYKITFKDEDGENKFNQFLEAQQKLFGYGTYDINNNNDKFNYSNLKTQHLVPAQLKITHIYSYQVPGNKKGGKRRKKKTRKRKNRKRRTKKKSRRRRKRR